MKAKLLTNRTIVACAHRSANIVCGILTSVVVCALCYVIVSTGLPLSLLSCTQWLADIRCLFPASPLSCTYWSINVKHGMPALSFFSLQWLSGLDVDCPHFLQNAHNGWPTSIVAYHHCPAACTQWSAYI